jgi:copper chaperone CopZ
MTNPETRTLDLLDTTPADSGGCGCGGCGCGSTTDTTPTNATAPSDAKETPMTDQTTRTYQVTGMTCGHCASSVTSELKALDGVSDVNVDLVAGGTSTVTVTSTSPLEDTQVAAALDEAGDYQLA